MAKTLWVVGAGIEAVDGIRLAQRMGLQVIASDGRMDAPGMSVADSAVQIDTYDAERTAVASTAFQRVDGVIAMCADVPVTVAAVAAARGLPGLPVSVAALGADKWAMKQALLQAGVPTAQGWRVRSGTDISDLLLERAGRALAVKPLDSRGARGVTKIVPGRSASRAFSEALAQSPTGRVMAEEWLDGPQLSTETVVLSARTQRTFILDRNYDRLGEFAPYVIEDGADGPARLSTAAALAVRRCVEHAAVAIVGDRPCTVKGDVVWAPGRGPVVVELALRLSGGFMSTRLIPLMTGVDFVGAAIRIALGEDVSLDDLMPSKNDGVAIRYKIPPGCTCHPDRLGYAIASAPTRAGAVNAAEQEIFYGRYQSTRVV